MNDSKSEGIIKHHRMLTGRVVSDRMSKTRTVLVERRVAHALVAGLHPVDRARIAQSDVGDGDRVGHRGIAGGRGQQRRRRPSLPNDFAARDAPLQWMGNRVGCVAARAC